MRQLLFVFISISYIFAVSYSDGYKLYKQAKKELRVGNAQKANKLFQESLKIFESSKNSSQAILKVAELYCNGWGVKEDKKKAKEYLKKAEQLGGTFTSDKCLKILKGESK